MNADPERYLAERLRASKVSRPLHIMEVCGTHTLAIRRLGLHRLLPDGVRLISGPGCPVCVTPDAYVDEAVHLARRGFILATFGDMVRVPGTSSSLQREKAAGASLAVVYSPLEALQLAGKSQRNVVFLAVGFETTAPAIASTVQSAQEAKSANFSLLTSLRTIPPALQALVRSETPLDGLLLPGHVSAIIGAAAYRFLGPLSMPAVISGFGAREIISSLILLLRMIERGEPAVVNNYRSVVRERGNARSRRILDEVFMPCDTEWRGLGVIPGSGLALRPHLQEFDARRHLEMPASPVSAAANGCRCGDVLKGLIDPPACPLFGSACTPENPRGACMVSTEGSCHAWYRYE